LGKNIFGAAAKPLPDALKNVLMMDEFKEIFKPYAPLPD
jgi:hypothetical protein